MSDQNENSNGKKQKVNRPWKLTRNHRGRLKGERFSDAELKAAKIDPKAEGVPLEKVS